MEAPVDQNPELRRWLESQNGYTRKVLDWLPQRGALRTRLPALAALADVVTAVPQVSLAEGRWFYLKLEPGEQTPKLYARDVRARADRELLDPDTLPGGDASHWAID